MKRTSKIYFLGLFVAFLSSCESFEDLQLDPNRPVQAEPSLILTQIETNAFSSVSLGAALASRQLIYTNSLSENQYYGWQRASFNDYNQLRQVSKLAEEADRKDNGSYRALALFFEANYLVELSQFFGDIPASEAVLGGSGNFSPIYDPQERVYLSVLEKLEEANSFLGPESGEILGDIIFNGDILKWKKLINSFHLRVLMSLSIKENNVSLAVADRFDAIYSNPTSYPIMTSNQDNGALVYVDIEGNRYPTFNSNELRTAYYMEKSFIDRLKSLNDPRLFVYADKETNGRNLDDFDPTAYSGLGGADALSTNTNLLLEGVGSPIDSRYHSDPVNQPSLLMGYAELEFIIAEAAIRNWISADPRVHYENGIRASMEFNGVSPKDTEAYLSQESVQLGDSDALERLLTEKHTAFFMNTGWEPFFDQRRTGIPEFSLSEEIINPSGIPKRWMYPQSEIQLNLSNLNEALDRQFGGDDDINGVPWILKP
ncbi:SusD/RagB family nutrient-binding outer membrane lipoprotein [Algoriphagus hitonicola]|uniref:Starch-binding associating with outer membrane n=1 Tax=Algoriphagus hitonicola TaxID=435880 RepID=A0A1I2XIV2_9BACT|nr:SusD/RagB family nutrient-binding outer membrane lipoprotein [Algoriphagus hitonicola]SFH13414.1 Starch-binding associating with outer membrane [Algoriphagus hitonicola]